MKTLKTPSTQIAGDVQLQEYLVQDPITLEWSLVIAASVQEAQGFPVELIELKPQPEPTIEKTINTITE